MFAVFFYFLAKIVKGLLAAPCPLLLSKFYNQTALLGGLRNTAFGTLTIAWALQGLLMLDFCDSYQKLFIPFTLLQRPVEPYGEKPGKEKKIKYCRCVFCVFSFPLFRRLQLTLNLDPIYIIRGQNKSHPLTSAQAVSNSEVAMRAVGRRACPSLEKNNLELMSVDKWFLDHIRLKKIPFLCQQSTQVRSTEQPFLASVEGRSVWFLEVVFSFWMPAPFFSSLIFQLDFFVQLT